MNSIASAEKLFESLSEDSNSPEQKKIFRNLSSQYETLFETKDESDVIFLVGAHEQIIKAHANIIKARCPVFKPMLSYPAFTEAKEKIIKVDNFECEAFNEFLRYLYCGKTKLNAKIAANLIPIAHMYLAQDLLQKCEKYLLSKIVLTNVLDLFVIAHLHNANKLEEKCNAIILENGEELVTTKEFKNLECPNSCLKELLKACLSSPPKKRVKDETTTSSRCHCHAPL